MNREGKRMSSQWMRFSNGTWSFRPVGVSATREEEGVYRATVAIDFGDGLHHPCGACDIDLPHAIGFENAGAQRIDHERKVNHLLHFVLLQKLNHLAASGFAAQVDGLCELMKGELGEAAVVATGGLAAMMTPLSRTIQHLEPWITLIGLRLIWERNQ